MMVEMQCGMCAVGSVMCNLYLNVMVMAWCEVECGRDVEWCAEMWWWFDVNYGGIISDMVWLKCKMCDVEYGAVWNVAIMQDVESYDVMWNVTELWCGIVVTDKECGICNVIASLSTSDITLQSHSTLHMPHSLSSQFQHIWHHTTMCCQMWWWDVKSRCGGVMWCGIWCGVKYAVVLNVVWPSCGCGMV